MTKVFKHTKNESQMGKVAVIMTSFSRDTMLDKAILSVRNQTLKDFILYIIDDNSTLYNPQTKYIIEKHAWADRRIVYFERDTTEEERAQRCTFCVNINFVLNYILDNKIAIKYVSYLPCDDYYLPKRLKVATSFLDQNPTVIACYNTISVISSKNKQTETIPVMGIKPQPISNAVTLLDHNCVTHRLDVLYKMEKPFWPTDKRGETGAPDGVFFNKLIKVGGPIRPVHTKEVLGVKLKHRNSIQGKHYKF